MKAKQITICCAVAALTFAAGASASEIYKWIDEDGNVHYEDRPTGAPTEERLGTSYSRTDSSAVNNRVQARLDRQAARNEAKAAEADAQQQAAAQAEHEAQREKACERARARLQTYLEARRLYRSDENGERVYLDDAERQEARQKAEEQISEHCY